MISNSIILAALAVIAIGVISYNLITNKKKPIPVRQRRIKYVKNYETESKSCDHPGVRQRRNANTEIKKTSCEKTESINKSNTDSHKKFPDVSPGPSMKKESLINDLDSLDQNKDENKKVQNIIQNIHLDDSEKLDVTKTVIDEDAEFSVSNVSATKANDLTRELTSFEQETNDLARELISFEQENSSESSINNVSEKLYKREVIECLKYEVETMSLSFLSSETDDQDDMSNFRSLDNADGKPIICKGCEESYANAVAQPCGHRYLCLDCAIKVHRIHRKCSICNFHIETYDFR